MKSILSKAAIAVVFASLFAINVNAATIHTAVADTGKMSKMGKMDKMGKMKKDKMGKMKKGKMGKDSTKM